MVADLLSIQAPCAYEPEKSQKNLEHTPAYSFGIKTNQKRADETPGTLSISQSHNLTTQMIINSIPQHPHPTSLETLSLTMDQPTHLAQNMIQKCLTKHQLLAHTDQRMSVLITSNLIPSE